MVMERRDERREFFSVAVWWPSSEDYGGVVTFRTQTEAELERQKLLRYGYKFVDIWKTTEEPVL